MQTTQKTEWTNCLAAVFIVLLLPFYIGYIDSPLEILLMYAMIGGVGWTIGEALVSERWLDLRSLLVISSIYAATVLVFGFVPFALAIWLI